MLITQKLKLLKIRTVSGEAGKKSGKPYSFNVASLLDEASGEVLEMNIHEDVSVKDLKDERNVDVDCDIEIRQKGFDLSGRVTRLELL